MAEIATAALPAVVLVHGAFVDGSSWEGVYKILKKDGYDVSVVQNPTLSLADDAAKGRQWCEIGDELNLPNKAPPAHPSVSLPAASEAHFNLISEWPVLADQLAGSSRSTRPSASSVQT
jgi:hypothetical protein